MPAPTRLWSHSATWALTVLLTLSSPLAAGAARSVTNYGTDSSSCGSAASPCRSISQAIENASTGDVIWVGAGHYGNIHGDPGFSAPGDEQPQTFPNIEFSSCMICVLKAVTINSYDGAAVTFIDSGPSPTFSATVMIAADGAVFGSVGHGFTITGENANGVVVDLENWSTSTTGVTVAGNVDLRDGTGFVVSGPIYDPFTRCPAPQFCPPFKGKIVLSHNQAIGNGTGFLVRPIVASAAGQPLQFLIDSNEALGTGTGFRVYPGVGGECDDCDFNNFAGDVSTIDNVAADGGVGFALYRAGTVSQNIATHNSQYGFLMVEGGPFSWNSAIGNSGPGVIAAVEAPESDSLVPPVSFGAFAHNNFFGNDRNRPQLSLGDYPSGNYNPGPSAHCGLLNMGAVWSALSILGGHSPPNSPPNVQLQAIESYWGSANGPAAGSNPPANAPGDAAGGSCDENKAVTISKPFATATLAISPP